MCGVVSWDFGKCKGLIGKRPIFGPGLRASQTDPGRLEALNRLTGCILRHQHGGR
jgi:hypothetical protein